MLLISASVRPLASRNWVFCAVGASRMESSERNLEAVSIREALDSEGPCSAASCGGVLSGWWGELEDSCCCHDGVPLGLDPSESLMTRFVVFVQQDYSRRGSLKW